MPRTREITAESIRTAAGRSKLLMAVAEWVIEKSPDYGGDFRGPLKDLFYGGCESAMVSHLVSTADAAAFGRQHVRAIFALAVREAERSEERNLFALLSTAKYESLSEDADGALNQLAWWGFETAAGILARRIGY